MDIDVSSTQSSPYATVLYQYYTFHAAGPCPAPLSAGGHRVARPGCISGGRVAGLTPDDTLPHTVLAGRRVIYRRLRVRKHSTACTAYRKVGR
jgi:hypothetical protein